MPRVRDPVDHCESEVQYIVGEVLGIADPPPSKDLFRLGATSMDLLRVQELIESRLKRRIDLGTLMTKPTAEAIASELRRQGEKISTGGVVRRMWIPGGAGKSEHAAVICFPYAADSAMLRQSRLDQRTRAVYTCAAPIERDTGLGHYFVSAGKKIAAELMRTKTEGGWAIAGYCAAAGLAIETARVLAEHQCPVASVTLIDPTWNPTRTSWEDLAPVSLSVQYSDEMLSCLDREERRHLEGAASDEWIKPIEKLVRRWLPALCDFSENVRLSAEEYESLVDIKLSYAQCLIAAQRYVPRPIDAPVAVFLSEYAMRKIPMAERWHGFIHDPSMVRLLGEHDHRSIFGSKQFIEWIDSAIV